MAKKFKTIFGEVFPFEERISRSFVKVGNTIHNSGCFCCDPFARKGKRHPKKYKKTLRDHR